MEFLFAKLPKSVDKESITFGLFTPITMSFRQKRS